MQKRDGFTLMEVLVVVAIIGIISTLALVSLMAVRVRARDVKRKAEVNQIGRLITASCYVPDAGGGDYDIADLLSEMRTKYPQFASSMAYAPRDPRTGTATQSFYRYVVTGDGKRCALYANLENGGEPVTITNITAPTAGGGTGVLAATTDGWNGSPKYFQISN
ncbi:MAG: type II secretion system protein [Patescibacteria group bacterium]|nr:type II secretion system protein [Patescibacteria group bacterium]